MRNFFLCLMVSQVRLKFYSCSCIYKSFSLVVSQLRLILSDQGVPMIYMGDEYGHTKGGNNNTYCHDNYVTFHTQPLIRSSFESYCWLSSLFCLLQCRSTISSGIRRKNPHQTSSDFAVSWQSSASEYMLDVNSTCAVCLSTLLFVPQVPSYMSSQLAVNVSPLAWMTSLQQRGCNGMVMLLEHQIGQTQAVLWPLHWYAFSLQLACHFSRDILEMWLSKKKENINIDW